MPKPRKTPRRPTGTIPEQPPPTPLLTWSFPYFREEAPFAFPDDRASYGSVLFARLRALSSLTPQELRSSRSPALRSHPIRWTDTSRPDGFGLSEQMEEAAQTSQFAVSANEHGRIHGFWLGNIFYLVRLDPDHELYPGG